MVCLGNICRSPLAEGIMRNKIEQYGLNATVDSCGTGGWHAGEHPDKRSIANAKLHGLDISGLRARKFTVSDFDNFDLIYVMDYENYNSVLALSRSQQDADKVDMLLNVCEPESNKSVPDPYYDYENGFEIVYQLINEACEKIAQKITH